MAERICIASLGELLVEFVCLEPGNRNLRAAPYMGPFPSGAPGIFIDQAARIAVPLGGRAVFAGAVGDDAFGQVIIDRLAAAGVDPSLIRTVPGVPTGSAFVSYDPDGSRDFVFNIARSAAAHLPDPATILDGFTAAAVTHLHISGSTLGDPAMRAAAVEVSDRAWASGIAISVDPNIRRELMRDGGYTDAVRHLIGIADCVLPSDADAAILFPEEDFASFAATLLRGQAKAVVLKRGAAGCTGMDAHGFHTLPAHRVSVVDPTGAGDCFCATFVTLMAAGHPLKDALAHANAAGALAVTKLGPMEGNASLPDIAALS